MKKLLTLLGAVSITASGASNALAINATPTTQVAKKETLSTLSTFNNFETDTFAEITNLKEAYEKLTENEKISFANEMAKISELEISQVGTFLANSNNVFINNNKETIENMFLLSNSISQIPSVFSSTFLSLDNVDWMDINKYLDLGFGDSNNYSVDLSTYGPSAWWKVWEWGWKIDFSEGILNYARVIKFLYSQYNGLDFSQLEHLLESAKEIFDYLVNIEKHKTDKGQVLYDMLVNAKSEFKNSNLPLTQAFYEILDSVISKLEDEMEIDLPIIGKIKIIPKNFPISTILKERSSIEAALGMSIEEFGKSNSDMINEILQSLKQVSVALNVISDKLPEVVWNWILDAINSIASQMVSADKNHNGVYLQFQQFVIPLGFKAR